MLLERIDISCRAVLETVLIVKSLTGCVRYAVTAVDKQQKRVALQSVQQQAVEAAGPTTIGDLIKQKMNK